ncbi:MAG: DNA repair protein RecN [Alloprevotella sp.]|nr:DNA repair protein RecN [Prevotellamassilia sp.]MDY5761671.1 DNA repair protein RecN [Alloprevotella sp.]
MLKNLQIAHYALIDTLDVDFNTGFSVITGETGAGKSIILGALGLLMGNRADAKAIKAGEKKCSVEAVFDIENLHLEAFFKENDLDYDPQDCIVRREVSANGKSRAFINDQPVSLATLKAFSTKAIDIHSQHQNLLMGREHFLLDVIDGVAKNQKTKNAYSTAYGEWKEAVKALEALKNKQDGEQKDFLAFKLAELEEANLEEGEEETLEAESRLLEHAEEIKAALYEAASLIQTADRSVTDQLRQSGNALAAVAQSYEKADELVERIESARIDLADVADELQKDLSRIDFDPTRLDFVTSRLNTLYSLEKKHHTASVAELIALRDNLRDELHTLDNFEAVLEEKTAQVEALRSKLQKACAALTTTRVKAAGKLTEALATTLRQLGMPNVSLDLPLTAKASPDASGGDAAQLRFSANKNVALQDVSEIASGGEIARLMLALKAFVAQDGHLPTLIFDEIDTGVSGAMAEKMACVMQEMGHHSQVICITHLPQIAARGQAHYRVYKAESEEGTTSHLIPLTDQQRVEEIAHMLSGTDVTQAAIDNAKSLLQTATS